MYVYSSCLTSSAARMSLWRAPVWRLRTVVRSGAGLKEEGLVLQETRGLQAPSNPEVVCMEGVVNYCLLPSEP